MVQNSYIGIKNDLLISFNKDYRQFVRNSIDKWKFVGNIKPIIL